MILPGISGIFITKFYCVPIADINDFALKKRPEPHSRVLQRHFDANETDIDQRTWCRHGGNRYFVYPLRNSTPCGNVDLSLRPSWSGEGGPVFGSRKRSDWDEKSPKNRGFFRGKVLTDTVWVFNVRVEFLSFTQTSWVDHGESEQHQRGETDDQISSSRSLGRADRP